MDAGWLVWAQPYYLVDNERGKEYKVKFETMEHSSKQIVGEKTESRQTSGEVIPVPRDEELRPKQQQGNRKAINVINVMKKSMS